MPDTVALRLRHLYMEIVDGTGPEGDDEYIKYDRADRTHPWSNVQLQFPNKDHVSGMLGLVSRCKGLESLGLVGTHRIDLDSLDLQSTNGGLKNIYLSRVMCTTEELLRLLPFSDAEGTICNVEAFQIEESSLWDGTWEAIFARLAKAPSLLHLCVFNLIYDEDGASSDYYQYNHRLCENSRPLWTEKDSDWERLREVLRAVQDRGHTLDVRMEWYVKIDTGIINLLTTKQVS